MEKTIENRAKKFSKIAHYQILYKKICNEQKAIDVARACGAYCAICYNRQTGCDKLCNDLKEFRKAMEE